MRILKTKRFSKWARGMGLSDQALCDAVKEIESGLHDGDLGSGLLKKRVPLPGRGKRGGARTLLAHRQATRTVFIYGFPKNEKDNITGKEEEALKRLSKEMLGYSEAQIDRAVQSETFDEVECNEDEAQQDS